MSNLNTRYYQLDHIARCIVEENGIHNYEYELYGTYSSKATLRKFMYRGIRYFTIDVENITLEIDDNNERFISFDVKRTKGEKGVSSTKSYRYRYYKNCVDRLYIDVNYPCDIAWSRTPVESTRINDLLNKFIKLHDAEWVSQKKPNFYESEYRWG